jgi:hypothetical protein
MSIIVLSDVHHHSVWRWSPFCLTCVLIPSNVRPYSVRRRPSLSIHPISSIQPLPSIDVRPSPFIPVDAPYLGHGTWDNTMTSYDESIITQPKLKYQLRTNTQSFEPIFLSSRFSQWYHQAFIVPLSSSTTLTRNSGSGYTTSMVHQSPFKRVN